MNSGRGRFFLLHLVSASVHAKPFVAIVDANALERGTLAIALSDLQVDIEGFASAESFLESEHLPPSCLISDIALPGMSGLDLLRRLQVDGAAPPVILLGEESDVVSAVAAMRAGASDFIEKTHVDLAIARRVSQLLNERTITTP